MGFSIAVIACDVADKDKFLAEAGLSDTGQSDVENETRLSGADFGDYYLIWRNWRETKGRADPEYEQLSNGAQFTLLDINETVMVAQVRRFENGRCVWAVTGDDTGLSIEGSAPVTKEVILPGYTAYLRSMNLSDDAASIENDGFGLASEVFVMLTGFRYDGLNEVAFTEISGEMPRSKPKWKFW